MEGLAVQGGQAAASGASRTDGKGSVASGAVGMDTGRRGEGPTASRRHLMTLTRQPGRGSGRGCTEWAQGSVQRVGRRREDV